MNIEIKTNCDFTSIWDICAVGKDQISSLEQPISKVGHIRADHDGYKWWVNYYPCNEYLKSREIKEEIDAVGKYFIEDEFSGKNGLSKLFDYCHSHPEALVKNGSDEYNFYINGNTANFWIRVNARMGDYQLYVHIFVKDIKGASV